jgi:hypothetical protein
MALGTVATCDRMGGGSMKAARGLGLVAGVAFIAVGVWQVMMYAGAPASGRDVEAWFAFIDLHEMLGKAWGARIGVILLAIAPIGWCCDRAQGGWGTAARSFLHVWLPAVLLTSVFQTVSVERLRAMSEASPLAPDAANAAFTMWHALVEPAAATTAVVGAFGFSFLVASLGGKMPFVGLLLLVGFLLMTVLSLSPMTEAVTLAAFGALLAFVSMAAPRDPEPRL